MLLRLADRRNFIPQFRTCASSLEDNRLRAAGSIVCTAIRNPNEVKMSVSQLVSIHGMLKLGRSGYAYSAGYTKASSTAAGHS